MKNYAAIIAIAAQLASYGQVRRASLQEYDRVNYMSSEKLETYWTNDVICHDFSFNGAGFDAIAKKNKNGKWEARAAQDVDATDRFVWQTLLDKTPGKMTNDDREECNSLAKRYIERPMPATK